MLNKWCLQINVAMDATFPVLAIFFASSECFASSYVAHATIFEHSNVYYYTELCRFNE